MSSSSKIVAIIIIALVIVIDGAMLTGDKGGDAGSSGGGGGAAASGEKIILKAADDHDLTYPTTKGLIKMGELLKEWTNGRITVEVYHSAQLGSEKETIEQTQFGAIDINRVNINPVTQFAPRLKVFALPYIFRSADHMHNVLDGEIGKEMLKELEKHKLVGLGYYDSGQRSFYANKPIAKMADLKGLKIRVQKAEIMMAMTRAVGASPTPMAFEEVYTGLQTGVIDGAENNYPSWVTRSHHEVARYYMQDEHSRVPEIILFSKKTWDKLSPEDQMLIMKAAQESVPYQREQWNNEVQKSIKAAKAAGCTVVTDVDKTPFIKAMEPVYADHAADLQDLIKRIQAVK